MSGQVMTYIIIVTNQVTDADQANQETDADQASVPPIRIHQVCLQQPVTIPTNKVV